MYPNPGAPLGGSGNTAEEAAAVARLSAAAASLSPWSFLGHPASAHHHHHHHHHNQSVAGNSPLTSTGCGTSLFTCGTSPFTPSSFPLFAAAAASNPLGFHSLDLTTAMRLQSSLTNTSDLDLKSLDPRAFLSACIGDLSTSARLSAAGAGGGPPAGVGGGSLTDSVPFSVANNLTAAINTINSNSSSSNNNNTSNSNNSNNNSSNNINNPTSGNNSSNNTPANLVNHNGLSNQGLTNSLNHNVSNSNSVSSPPSSSLPVTPNVSSNGATSIVNSSVGIAIATSGSVAGVGVASVGSDSNSSVRYTSPNISEAASPITNLTSFVSQAKLFPDINSDSTSGGANRDALLNDRNKNTSFASLGHRFLPYNPRLYMLNHVAGSTGLVNGNTALTGNGTLSMSPTNGLPLDTTSVGVVNSGPGAGVVTPGTGNSGSIGLPIIGTSNRGGDDDDDKDDESR